MTGNPSEAIKSYIERAGCLLTPVAWAIATLIPATLALKSDRDLKFNTDAVLIGLARGAIIATFGGIIGNSENYAVSEVGIYTFLAGLAYVAESPFAYAITRVIHSAQKSGSHKIT